MKRPNLSIKNPRMLVHPGERFVMRYKMHERIIAQGE